MTDVTFVGGAYLLALGALISYAVALVRRLRAARSTRAALRRRAAADETGAATQPQVR